MFGSCLFLFPRAISCASPEIWVVVCPPNTACGAWIVNINQYLVIYIRLGGC